MGTKKSKFVPSYSIGSKSTGGWGRGWGRGRESEEGGERRIRGCEGGEGRGYEGRKVGSTVEGKLARLYGTEGPEKVGWEQVKGKLI